MTYHDEIQDRVRAALRASSESYQAIAESVGVHEVTLRRIGAGLKGISPELTERLAAHMGMKITVKVNR